MIILKRTLILFAGVVLLLQIPFAANRYRTARLATAVKEINRGRVDTTDIGYRDYKGVIHAHTFLGGHSTGTFFEIIEAAKANSLDFVVMTEHANGVFDTSSMTLNGRHAGVLFLGGNETSTADGGRFLVVEGFREVSEAANLSTRQLMTEIRKRGGMALQVYPAKSGSVHAEGMEVFSLHTNAKRMNPALFVADALWSYGAYPELTLARYFQRPDAELAAFDAESVGRRIFLFGGNDAHSNFGLFFGDHANNRFFELKYDRYETIFRLMRTHVLLRSSDKLDKQGLLEALSAGRTFIGIDAIGETDGFLFYADTPEGPAMMGDEVRLSERVQVLRVETPIKARVALFRNGEKLAETESSRSFEYNVTLPGAYRVEAYIDGLGAPFDEMPWIISNPIWFADGLSGRPIAGQANGLE